MSFKKLHHWKLALWGCSFFVLGMVCVKVLVNSLKFFDNSLLHKILLSTQHLTAWLFDPIPFSVGDLIYLVIFGFLIWGLRKFIRQPEERFVLINHSIFWMGLIFLIFQLRWGINYYRPAAFPIQKEYQKYNEEAEKGGAEEEDAGKQGKRVMQETGVPSFQRFISNIVSTASKSKPKSLNGVHNRASIA